MKKLLLLLAVMVLTTIMIKAQSTYGKIAPLGGVTASIGQELTFSYTNLAGANYYWSAYPSISSIPSSSIVFTTTVDTRTVKVKFLEPMVAFLCVTRYKAGTQPAMECISFNVINCAAVPTPSSISGPTPISSCGTYTYTTSAVAGASGYQWSGFVTGDKQTVDPEITVFGSDFKLGNNSLKVKALNECGGSGSFRSKTVVVNGISSPSSLTGPNTVSLGSNSPLNYTTTAVDQAAGYKWFGFATGEKTTSTPSISVAGIDFTEGLNVLSVRALDSCDVQSAGAASLNVTGQSLGTPSQITGPASISFCGNATYSTDNIVGAAQYVWSGFSTGNKITTVPNVSASWTDFVAGSSPTITVVAQDGSGNSSGSASLQISISSVPVISAPSGNVSPDFCSSSVYNVAPYPGATQYVWSIIQSGFTTTTTTNSVTINSDNWAPFGTTNTLTVYAVGCVNSNTASNTITPQITLSPIAGPSTINCPGVGSYSIAPVCLATSYRWVIEGNVIDTSTPNITITSAMYEGNVQIDVSALVGGQFTNPATKFVIINCNNPLSIAPSKLPVISPNPSNNTFTVTDIKPAESTTDSQIRVLSQDGRLIKSYTTKEASLSIEDLNLESGVYLIEIKSGYQQSLRKLLISK